MCEMPVSKLGYIVDGAPGIAPVLSFPQAVRDRFKESDTFLSQWGDFTVDNTSRYGKVPKQEPASASHVVVVDSFVDVETIPPVAVPPVLNLPTSDDLVDMQDLLPTLVAKAPLPTKTKD